MIVFSLTFNINYHLRHVSALARILTPFNICTL
ncbi:hypothetical protein VPHK449_0016 [Vibrio phage K449]